MKSRIYYASRHEKLPDNLQTTAAGLVFFYRSRGRYTIRRSAILREPDPSALNVLVWLGSIPAPDAPTSISSRVGCAPDADVKSECWRLSQQAVAD